MNINDKLKKEINDYRKFITNEYNIDIPKRLIQKENTFDSITINGIKTFVRFLEEKKNISTDEIDSLFEFIIKYGLEYAYYLIEEIKTEGIVVKLRFVKSILSYFENSITISIENQQKIDKLISDLSKLKSRIRYKDGKRGTNKELRRKTPIEYIIKTIKNLEEKYQQSQNFYKLKAKTALKFLIHLCWRANNIINLKIGYTLILKEGKWYYDFPPELQKAPEKEGNKLKSIKGVLPEILQSDVTEMVRLSSKRDFLFKNQSNQPYSSNSFGSYIKSITKKYVGEELNPHVFRDIVSTYLINNNVNPIYVSSLLWHKPANLTSVDLTYVKIDKNKAVLECNKHLMKLYKSSTEKKKTKIIGNDNIIYFKKNET